ncbi:cytochrome P450 [Aspergillus coremiiformis]|uniref:Cytochrome P450 n=1 Tax=Aspergillus coremiiformis TaxID=138285 RepID=A0A5N6ZDL1_9EURO|nr:cytochrome P450 [Aspergillus coremiiformis]
MSFTSLSLIVGAVSLCFLRWFWRNKKSRAPLPPGPPSKPIIGNLWDLPSPGTQGWLHWYKHKDIYGPISSVTIFGQTMIILNEARLAYELLEKRSAIHSSRTPFIFSRMAGWGDFMTMLEYSDRLRASRKIAHQQLGSNNAVSRFNHIQNVEVSRFLLRMLRDPAHWTEHIRKESGAVVLKITYGYTVEQHARDPLVDLIESCIVKASETVVPGRWLVDFIPILRYIPAWLPGGGETRAAQKLQKDARDFSDIPYTFTKQQMIQGTNEASIVSHYLQENDIKPGSKEEHLLKWAAATLYAGAGETTLATMKSVFIAMAMYPHVQRKAQEEIDRVIGTSRLPGHKDRGNLPYIDALVKEALRWHTIVPMGITHMAIEDDICEGYHIPKGAAILPNIWAFTHDPKEYHDPMVFKPERFLSDNDHTPERDPRLFSFGFGRRICPGRNLADSNLYLSIAQTLAAYNIRKPIRDGKEVDIQLIAQAGVISHPEPFDLNIKPRSAGHEELIRALEKQYPWEKGHGEELRRATGI